jgi:hypothetical protein
MSKRSQQREAAALAGYHADLIGRIIDFAQSLVPTAREDGRDFHGRKWVEESFDGLAASIQEGIRIGELSPAQATGRLAVFAELGSAIVEGQQDDRLRDFFGTHAQVYRAAIEAAAKEGRQAIQGSA